MFVPVIVEVPGETPVAACPLTVATLGVSELSESVEVPSVVELSDQVMIDVYACVPPIPIVADDGEIAQEATVGFENCTAPRSVNVDRAANTIGDT